MQVRPSRPSGGADFPDHLSDLDHIANPDIDLRQMAVSGCQAIAVVDLDHAAIAARRSRGHHLSVRGSAHRITCRGAEVETGMHRRAAEEWIAADSESAGEFDLADHRLSIGHEGEGPIKSVNLRAGDVNSIKLAFERPGVRRKLQRNEGPAHAGARCRRLQLGHVQSKIAKDPAHTPYPRFHAVFDGVQARHLTALDLVE